MMYVMAILMTDMMGGGNVGELIGEREEWVRRRWGLLTRSMMTLGQLVTFDSWGAEVEPFFFGYPSMFLALMCFMPITSLGIMNLMVGVMCNAAVEVSRHDEEVNKRMQLTDNWQALMDLRQRLMGLDDPGGDLDGQRML